MGLDRLQEEYAIQPLGERGTRENPAEFGETVKVRGYYYTSQLEAKVTLSNPIVGGRARRDIEEMSSSNEIAAGETGSLFDAKIELTHYKPYRSDLSDSGVQMRYIASNTEVHTDDGEVFQPESSIHLLFLDFYDLEFFSGETREVQLPLAIPLGEPVCVKVLGAWYRVPDVG